MQEIQLTKGLVTQIDDWNYDWLNQWKWYAKKDGKTYYAVRNSKNSDGSIYYKRTIIRMHNIIMRTPINKECDHIDHNGLNNQEYNLRDATHSQNIINRVQFNKFGYRGIHFNNSSNKWQAQIYINGKNKHLGVFSDPILAAQKYDEYALKYHGEFAITNFKTINMK